MQCPYCYSTDSSVTETRVTADGLRRRRVCENCKRRFTTYEKVGAPNLKVTKRDGGSEPFEAEKLAAALRRVAAHRNHISDDDLRRIARDIEAKLVDTGRKSVLWSDIVQLALARLRNIDPISEQRLAANYTDEHGRVRFGHTDLDSSQLGLPLEEEQ